MSFPEPDLGSRSRWPRGSDGDPGSTTEASQVIGVAPTGSLRSPCLHEVAGALGQEEVRHRVLAVTGV